MIQFKAGDRVLYIGATTIAYRDKVGTVQSVSPTGQNLHVKFDDLPRSIKTVSVRNVVRTDLPIKGPFDLGAKIVLKSFTSRSYVARPGATAIVCGYNENGNVVVGWIKGSGALDQSDGEYPVCDFNLVTNTGIVGTRPDVILVDEVTGRQPFQADIIKFLTSPQIARGRTEFLVPPQQLPKDPPAAEKGTFIIVLVDANGDLKPSPTPKPHDYWVDAEAEAERLSKKYPGSTFMVFKGVGSVKTPAPKAVWA